jgi:iron(III) transport system substrate-binding protein
MSLARDILARLRTPIATVLIAGLGCGAAAAQTAGWKDDWDRTVQAATQEGSLIISGPPGRQWREVLGEFEKAYPAIKLEITPMASRDYWPRFAKEREAGQYLWDLRVGGADAPSYGMKNTGQMTPVRDVLILPEIVNDASWAGGLDGLFVDNEKKFFAAFIAYAGSAIYYNAAAIKTPITIKELVEPKWTGKISMADPRGGAALVTMSVVYKVYGEDFIRKLIVDQKAVITDDPRQQLTWLASGRHPIAFGLPSAAVNDYTDRGAKLEYGEVGGIPIWSQGTGGIQFPTKAPHPNAAKLYINWLLTKDVQLRLTQALRLNSRRTDVPPQQPEQALDPEKIGQYVGSQTEDILPQQQELAKLLRQIIN